MSLLLVWQSFCPMASCLCTCKDIELSFLYMSHCNEKNHDWPTVTFTKFWRLYPDEMLHFCFRCRPQRRRYWDVGCFICLVSASTETRLPVLSEEKLQEYQTNLIPHATERRLFPRINGCSTQPAHFTVHRDVPVFVLMFVFSTEMWTIPLSVLWCFVICPMLLAHLCCVGSAKSQIWTRQLIQ